MPSSYTLILTGEVLPGFTPEAVWPRLAADFSMTPEKLTQIQTRMPKIIQRNGDPDKLQTLQDRFAQCGAQTEIYPPDGRPELFVLIDNAPRGPVPCELVERYLAHGVWAAESIRVASAGSTTWMPYYELNEAPSPPPVPPRPSPFPGSAMLAALPVRRDATCEEVVLLSTLPAGEAIHAGFWRRMAAHVIDWLVLTSPLAVLNLLPLLGFLLAIVINWLYHALMESSERQATLGKLVMGIKVVDEHGNRITFGRATGRYFGKILSGIILCIGYMMVGWTKRGQALHDMVAGTFVVFNDVQPGCTLPDKRPPMPWYGWGAAIGIPILFMTAVIGLLVAIAAPYYQDYRGRVHVGEAINATDMIRLEIVRRGCLSGNRVAPHPWIETAEVRGDDETQSCTITLTLGNGTDIPTLARGKVIELERNDEGNWLCSSSLPRRYLPPNCR